MRPVCSDGGSASRGVEHPSGIRAAGISGADTAIAASLYPNPAKPPTAGAWCGATSSTVPCDPANPGKCTAKDWQKTVQCYGTPEAPVDTVTPFAFHVNPDDPRQWTTKVHPHLANLDKCTWLVSDHVNKIHFQGPAGPITRYSPNSVTVSNGEMRITTRRTRPKTIDCGRVIAPNGPNNEANLTKACPYEAGNVFSYGMHGLAAVNGTQGTQPGDGHVFREGGRIQVRARIPATQGNMTALWTWQQDWRTHEREYDLLENWVNWPAMSAHSLQGPGTFARHVLSDEFKYSLSKEFHTYSMEWKKDDSFSYWLDNRHLVTWKDSTRPDGQRVNQDGQCVENRIFGNPFYMIFWNLIAEYDWAKEAAPLAEGQRPDKLYIDYIRYYEPCTDEADPACVESTLSTGCPNPCGGFGFFDGYNCYVGSPPAGRTATLADGQYAYKAIGAVLQVHLPLRRDPQRFQLPARRPAPGAAALRVGQRLLHGSPLHHHGSGQLRKPLPVEGDRLRRKRQGLPCRRSNQQHPGRREDLRHQGRCLLRTPALPLRRHLRCGRQRLRARRSPEGRRGLRLGIGPLLQAALQGAVPLRRVLRHGELLPAGDPRRGATVRRGKPHPDAGHVRPHNGLAEPAAYGGRGHGGERLRAVRRAGEEVGNQPGPPSQGAAFCMLSERKIQHTAGKVTVENV